MTKAELKTRTKKFALEVIRLLDELPQTQAARVIGNQVLRSSTSVAANYRASCRAKSPADFIYKITMVEEESDESLFWLELLTEAGIVKVERASWLMKEADELTAIFVASAKTAKKNNPK
jgi:four helix bundle protein